MGKCPQPLSQEVEETEVLDKWTWHLGGCWVAEHRGQEDASALFFAHPSNDITPFASLHQLPLLHHPELALNS